MRLYCGRSSHQKAKIKFIINIREDWNIFPPTQILLMSTSFLINSVQTSLGLLRDPRPGIFRAYLRPAVRFRSSRYAVRRVQISRGRREGIPMAPLLHHRRLRGFNLVLNSWGLFHLVLHFPLVYQSLAHPFSPWYGVCQRGGVFRQWRLQHRQWELKRRRAFLQCRLKCTCFWMMPQVSEELNETLISPARTIVQLSWQRGKSSPMHRSLFLKTCGRMVQ